MNIKQLARRPILSRWDGLFCVLFMAQEPGADCPSIERCDYQDRDRIGDQMSGFEDAAEQDGSGEGETKGVEAGAVVEAGEFEEIAEEDGDQCDGPGFEVR